MTTEVLKAKMVSKAQEAATNALTAAIEQAREEGRQAGIKEGRSIALMEAIDLLMGKVEAVENSISAPKSRRVGDDVMPRGATNMIVESIFRRRPATALTRVQVARIAKEEDKTILADTSIGRSFERLIQRGVIEQVGESKTWKLKG